MTSLQISLSPVRRSCRHSYQYIPDVFTNLLISNETRLRAQLPICQMYVYKSRYLQRDETTDTTTNMADVNTPSATYTVNTFGYPLTSYCCLLNLCSRSYLSPSKRRMVSTSSLARPRSLSLVNPSIERGLILWAKIARFSSSSCSFDFCMSSAFKGSSWK